MHTIPDKEDQSKIIGYALLLEDVDTGEDLQESEIIVCRIRITETRRR